jgi:predicted dehydrogenase
LLGTYLKDGAFSCMNRRDFLKRIGQTAASAAVISGAPMIVPAEVVGRGKRPAPSNRIVMAAIGNGWMGASNISGFLNIDDVQMLAVADVYKPHLNLALQKINGRYGNTDCAGYNDFREMLNRGDLDAVTIAIPDHWHAIPAIMAAQKGLDIYGEKPLSRFVVEGRALVNAVQRYGRIWQTGSWQRSRDNFRQACELVLNGRIGKVTHVDVGYGGGLQDFDHVADQTAPTSPPSDLDYDIWLGPAPYEPYCRARTHKNWRLLLDYGGGLLTDWVGHHLDIAHWGLGLDRTGPIEIKGTGNFVPGLYDVPEHFDVHCTYKNGVKIRITDKFKNGTKFYGENGKWVFVTRGTIDANPKTLLNEQIGPEEIRLTRSTDHYQNFIDCVKSRQETLTPAEIGHRSASVGNLGLISILTGRAIKWDPDTETIENDQEATRLLGRSMRAPWTLTI